MARSPILESWKGNVTLTCDSCQAVAIVGGEFIAGPSSLEVKLSYPEGWRGYQPLEGRVPELICSYCARARIARGGGS